MAIPKTLKNFTAFVDGVGYAGLIEEGTPPVLALRTEEWSGGGMAGTVDIPMGQVEKMEFDLSLKEYNPAIVGMFGHADLPVTFRGAQGPEGEAIIYECRGLMRETDLGGWKAGESGTLKVSFTATYVKLTIAATEAVEIDVENMIFKSGGVDHLAAIRQALGQ